MGVGRNFRASIYPVLQHLCSLVSICLNTETSLVLYSCSSNGALHPVLVMKTRSSSRDKSGSETEMSDTSRGQAACHLQAPVYTSLGSTYSSEPCDHSCCNCCPLKHCPCFLLCHFRASDGPTCRLCVTTAVLLSWAATKMP